MIESFPFYLSPSKVRFGNGKWSEHCRLLRLAGFWHDGIICIFPSCTLRSGFCNLETMRGYSDSDLKMLAVGKGLSELARLISRFSPILENYMTVLAELEKRNIVKKHADGTYSILT